MNEHPIRDRADFPVRMAAARARSLWELGDPSWADVILAAFLDPEEDRRALEGGGRLPVSEVLARMTGAPTEGDRS